MSTMLYPQPGQTSEAVRREFVGRDDVLNVFYDRFAYRHTKNVVYYYSLGGGGKTWLLKKIYIDLFEDPFRSVTNIIDFFDTRNHSVSGLQNSIRSRLERLSGPELFWPYEEVLEQIERARTDPNAKDTGVLSSLESQRNQTFIDCCNQAILGQEVILLFDTFERVQQLYAGRWLLKEFIPATRDLIIAICGRPIVEPNGKIQPADVSDSIVSYELPGFRKQEVGELASRIAGISLPENSISGLLEITSGNPLLIALVMEQAGEETSKMDQFLQINEQAELRKKLSFPYSEPTSINRLIWAMALFKRRFNMDMLRFLMESPEDSLGLQEVDQKRLRKMRIIKEYPELESHLLHDEAQVIISDVLDNVIQRPDLQKTYDLIVEQYYPMAIQESATDDRYLSRQLIAERLGYLLDRVKKGSIDHNQEYESYLAEIETSQEYDFEELLWSVIREHLDRFIDQGYQISYERGERLSRLSLFSKAVEHYAEMRLLFPEKSQEFGDRQGFALLRLGKTSEAIKVFEEGLSGLQKQECGKIAEFENSLGQAKLGIGQWDRALEHFTEAIRQFTKAGDKNQMAGAYINRGFIYANKGQYRDAIEENSHALRLLDGSPEHDFGIEHRRMYANMNMGTALRHSTYYQNAEDYYLESLRLSEKNKDREGLVYSLQQLGINDCLRARAIRIEGKDLDLAIEKLDRAWERLTISLSLAHQTNWRLAIGSGLSRLAKVYEEIYRLTSEQALSSASIQAMDQLCKRANAYKPQSEFEMQYQIVTPGQFTQLGLLEKTARLFELSALVADDANDFHRALDSLMNLGRLLIELKQFEIVPLVINHTERIKSYDYQADLFSSINDLTVADMEFDQGHYDSAMRLYMKAYVVLAKQTGYASYLLTDRLKEFADRLRTLPIEQRLIWCDVLEERWRSQGIASIRPDMLRLLEDIRFESMGM